MNDDKDKTQESIKKIRIFVDGKLIAESKPVGFELHVDETTGEVIYSRLTADDTIKESKDFKKNTRPEGGT